MVGRGGVGISVLPSKNRGREGTKRKELMKRTNGERERVEGRVREGERITGEREGMDRERGSKRGRERGWWRQRESHGEGGGEKDGVRGRARERGELDRIHKRREERDIREKGDRKKETKRKSHFIFPLDA